MISQIIYWILIILNVGLWGLNGMLSLSQDRKVSRTIDALKRIWK